jgi:microcin C transport system ATP-binding protein
MNRSNEILLAVDNLSVEFMLAGEPKRVVHGVTFDVKAGEKFALVGESGSGKTVTALAIQQLNDPSRVRYPTGSIRFGGRDLLHLPEDEIRSVRGREIGMIFQEPMTSLNALYTIGDQLMEPLVLHLKLTEQQARARAIELLARARIPDPEKRLGTYPHMLSGGQRQRVMIAMALACNPKLLIADEPTTALDVTIQAQILALLEDLQREFNMSVLFITHDLNLVRRFADRVAVMQEGKIVEQGELAEVFGSPKHVYTRRLLDSEPKPLSDDTPPDGPILLKGEGMRMYFPIKGGWLQRKIGEVKAVDDVSIELRESETVGIVGESGSGKTTLGLSLLRLLDAQGRVVFDGADLTHLRERELRPKRRFFQVIFQDPYSSLSPRMTIEDIVGEGLEVHFPQLSERERRDKVIAVLKEVGLTPDMLWRYPHEFSGGQRQRIAIARAVVLEPKLILLDEPTSALDVSVQKQVLELLRRLQEAHNIGYLFITHDLRVIRAMAHRIFVMREGKVVEQGPTESVFANPKEEYTRLLLNASLYLVPEQRAA